MYSMYRGKRLNGDGNVIVTPVLMTNAIVSAPDCCPMEFDFLWDNMITFTMESFACNPSLLN